MGGVNARLDSAARFVRQGAVFADIGTDHAYLPLFLLKEGRITHAFCTDVNEGPLKIAEKNACAEGLSGSITFRLADGAEGLMDEGITDYAICGMGGELIAAIIDRSKHLFDPSLSLILQPMSRQEHLRSYLYQNGFSIKCESYSYDGGKYYVCMLVCYTGECVALDEFEAHFGAKNTEYVNKSAQIGYLKTKLAALNRAAKGKLSASENAECELRLIKYGESLSDCILAHMEDGI